MREDADYPQGCQPILDSSQISISQQIERLRKLAGCLYDCKPNNDDEVKQPDRFRKLFFHLSDESFLSITNAEFRIYLSLCLVNILRVFHPETPTAESLELKPVYAYIFRTLRGLGDIPTESPKFNNYFHLTEAIEKVPPPLSDMKDADLNETYSLARSIIREILYVPSGKGWVKSMENCRRQLGERQSRESEDNNEEEEEDVGLKVRQRLLKMATTALTDLDQIPNEILDVLFYHIISPQRSNFVEARLLTEDIIRACQDDENCKLTECIQKVIGEAVTTAKLSEEFELTGANSKNKYFELLKCLHHIDYQLVATAVEGLPFWFQVSNPSDRKEVVEIVGQMTADRTCEFGKESNKSTWTAFLGAAKDTDPNVRLEFVKQSRNVITSNHTHLRGNIITSLILLSKDMDDDIRAEVVRSVTDMAKYRLENLSDKILRACADRMKDRASVVRIFATKCLMDLYCHVMTASPLPCYHYDTNNRSDGTATYTESDKQCVRFIPLKVFQMYRLTQRNPAYQDSRLTIERYVQLHFVPYRVEAKKRIRVMMDLLRNLDDIGVLMFADVINRSAQLRRAMIAILSQISKSGDVPVPEFTADMKERIRRIVKIFPEAAVLEKVMMTFVNQISEDDETFRAVKQLMADRYRSKDISDAAQTVKKLMAKKISAKTQLSAFHHFIDRIAPLSFDMLAARELVETVAETVTQKLQMKRWAEDCIERDLAVLKIFAEHFGHLFVDDDIVEKIRSSMLNSEEPQSVEAGLNALIKVFQNSTFRKKLEDEATKRERWFLALVKNLKDLIMRTDAEYRRSCKLATRLLVRMLEKEKTKEFFEENLDSLLDRLHLESDGTANAFQVLGEIFSSDTKHYLTTALEFLDSEKLEPFLTSRISSVDDPEEFNEFVHIEKQAWPKYTMAKVYAAKFATKVILTYHSAGSEDRKKMDRVNKTLVDGLGSIIARKGDLGGEQCELEKARLRANAASCLLKLAQVIQFRLAMDTTLYKQMSYQITDEAYCVRLHYCHHVKKGLAQKLPIEFGACYGLVNLGQYEEEGESRLENFKAICMNHAQQAFAERTDECADRLKVPVHSRAMFCSETVIAYVVWLLANYQKLDKIESDPHKDDDDEVLDEKCRNVNLLAELQESLWCVLDAQKNARCNMQKVFKVLEKLKTCGDKPARSDRKMSKEATKEHNKKLWALADLGIQMMIYRAKVRNEDDESKEAGYNLQFFYSCTAKDSVDPSNVYAPDILIKDEKHRAGRAPKHGRTFQVADLMAEFSPPPVNGNDSTGSSSTTVKNTSKRGANTSGGAKRRRKRGESDSESTKTPPIVKKTRSKRGVFDLPDEEEEDDEDVEEVMPVSKRRAAPSTSNGNKRTSRGKKNEEVEEESDEDEDPNISLDKIVLSPILDESSGRTRRSARAIAATATIIASTPIVAPKSKTPKRKRAQEEETIEDSDPEEEPEEVSPKKRTSGRRAPVATPSPSKKKSPAKKKTKSEVKATPKKNKYGLPMEEEEDEAPAPPPSVRTRTSSRLSKK